jgi:thiol:disulfide interchange protein DsbA
MGMRLIKYCILVLALACSTNLQAVVMEGKDYKLLTSPQPINTGNKIEVLEFFYYECPHCYHLQGPLSIWEKKMPKDVELQFVPVIFRDSEEPTARTFYALQMLGQSARLHKDLFEALHVSNIDLSNETKITEYVTKHGVDRGKFGAAYNSFMVKNKIASGNHMLQNYGVRGTPSIVVNGKYIITGLQPDETVRVLDEVIALARKERNKR